jgi:hypothetical protein
MLLRFYPPIGTTEEVDATIVFTRIFNGSEINRYLPVVKVLPPKIYKPVKKERIFVDKPEEIEYSIAGTNRFTRDGRLIEVHPCEPAFDPGRCDCCSNYAVNNIHWWDLEDSREFDKFRACAKHSERWLP